jgi:hypothetical protein
MIVMLSSSLDPNDKKKSQRKCKCKKLLSKLLRVEQFLLLTTQTKANIFLPTIIPENAHDFAQDWFK